MAVEFVKLTDESDRETWNAGQEQEDEVGQLSSENVQNEVNEHVCDQFDDGWYGEGKIGINTEIVALQADTVEDEVVDDPIS